jgi:hypothetical protein
MDELFQVGEEIHPIHEMSSSVSTTDQPSLTTIQNDGYIWPVLKLLLIAVQAAAGDYEDQHVVVTRDPKPRLLPTPCGHLSFFGGCVYLISLYPSLSFWRLMRLWVIGRGFTHPSDI